VLVVNRDSNNISKIDTSNDKVAATIPTSSATPVSAVGVK